MKPTSVDEYIESSGRWKSELHKLCKLFRELGFDEAIKWGRPVFSHQGKNIAGIGGFKHHVAIWFFQGADLSDPKSLLRNAQPGKTQSMRQIRITEDNSVSITAVKALLKEAKKAVPRETSKKPIGQPVAIKTPAELQAALNADSTAQQQFKSLSPAKQREFREYIQEAKQPATKQRRLEKILPLIRQGVGLNDKYRK